MSAAVLTNSQVVYGSADLTPFTGQIAWLGKANMLDTTNFGSGGYHAEIPGLKAGSFGFTFNQDYAASQIDVIIRTTLGGLGAFAFIDIKATNAARSATNPSFVAAFYVSDYTFLSGSVGNKNGFSVTWNTTGQFAWLTS